MKSDFPQTITVKGVTLNVYVIECYNTKEHGKAGVLFETVNHKRFFLRYEEFSFTTLQA